MYSRFKEQEYKPHFLEASQSLRSREHSLYSYVSPFPIALIELGHQPLS